MNQGNCESVRKTEKLEKERLDLERGLEKGNIERLVPREREREREKNRLIVSYEYLGFNRNINVRFKIIH